MKTTDQLYEELRAVIGNGNESMTHEDALAHVVELQALAAIRAAVGYALYDIEHGGSRLFVWADQYEPSGDPAKTLVVPLVAEAAEVVHGRHTVRIIMDIRGGALQAVYGDRLPEGVQVEFILRDYDNIAAGDADPMNEDYAPDVYYW